MRSLLLLSLLLTVALPQSRNTLPAGFVVLNGNYQVKAQGYNIYPIRVPVGKSGVLTGRITVHGGVSQDAEICVFDQPNVEAFINRQSASALYCSGRVKMQTFEVIIPPGVYNILINNSYSLLTPKTVTIFAGLRFEDGSKSRQPFIPNGLNDEDFADAKYSSSGKLISLKGLFPAPSDCENSPFSETVIVTDTHYDEEDLEYFTVKRPSGQRKNIYVNWQRITKPDQSVIHELIKEGTQLSVKGFMCGNGGYWHADEIVKKQAELSPGPKFSNQTSWRSGAQ